MFYILIEIYRVILFTFYILSRKYNIQSTFLLEMFYILCLMLEAIFTNNKKSAGLALNVEYGAFLMLSKSTIKESAVSAPFIEL